MWMIFLRQGLKYVAQAGFDLSIPLAQPPECWDYGNVPLCLLWMTFSVKAMDSQGLRGVYISVLIHWVSTVHGAGTDLTSQCLDEAFIYHSLQCFIIIKGLITIKKCLCCFSCRWDKIPWPEQLKGERICLGSQFNPSRQESPGSSSWSHDIHGQEAESDVCQCSACSLLFMKDAVQDPSRGKSAAHS